MIDIRTLAAGLSPWTIATYFGGALIGMALEVFHKEEEP